MKTGSRATVWVSINVLLFCALVHTNAHTTPSVCNGSAALCDRRYNEVVYPSSHNGSAFLKGKGLKPNVRDQDQNLTDQMNAGIRATKIPVHGYSGRAYACHGACDINHDPMPLETVLGIIKKFLDTHPNEVFTLLLEDFIKQRHRAYKAFEKSGIDKYVYYHDSNQPWPTLGQLIERGKRLVVFMAQKKGTSEWGKPFNPTWRYIWDTPFEYSSTDQIIHDHTPLRTDRHEEVKKDTKIYPYRGSHNFYERRKAPENKLWIMWHFVTSGKYLGIRIHGSLKAAKYANQREHILNRARHYMNMTDGRAPNFIFVDFIECPHKDVISVAQQLNGI